MLGNCQVSLDWKACAWGRGWGVGGSTCEVDGVQDRGGRRVASWVTMCVRAATAVNAVR